MGDIVTRLRHAEENGICEWQVLIDAAAEIERLRAAGDALIAAIRNHDLREQHIKAWEAIRS